MSDLSNLLGDVYGDHSSPDAAPVRHEPAAFDRIPTAPVMAPAPMPVVDLSAIETHAPVAAPAWTTAPSMSVSAPVPAMAGGSQWANGDDDIFPTAKGSKKKK